MQNGIFYCSFTRDNYLEGQKDVFDLNKNWFMMFAEGPAVNGKDACKSECTRQMYLNTHVDSDCLCIVYTLQNKPICAAQI